MAIAHTIRMVLGIVGNVISLFLFLSPVPTFYKIWKWKSTRNFSGVPYVATMLNCILWSFYGLPLVHPDSLLVLTINATGFVMEAVYIAMFFIYCKRQERVKLLKMLIAIFIFMAAVVTLTLLLAHTHDKRSLIVGIICDVFNIGMYAAPLTVMKTVIQTKSVKYMPLFVSLGCFGNGVIWTAYACVPFDVFILASNGLGVLLTAAQLVIYGIYYKSTRWDMEDDEKSRNSNEMVSASERESNKARGSSVDSIKRGNSNDGHGTPPPTESSRKSIGEVSVVVDWEVIPID